MRRCIPVFVRLQPKGRVRSVKRSGISDRGPLSNPLSVHYLAVRGDAFAGAKQSPTKWQLL